MRRLAKFFRMPAVERRYLIEAALSLVVARFALRWLPYRRLSRLLERAPRQPEVTGAEREQLRKGVQWAIDRAAPYLPGEIVCFPRAVAAQQMLRRRRVGTTVYYGANTLPERGLTAHVWLQDGSVGVVGDRSAQDYHIMARYPTSKP